MNLKKGEKNKKQRRSKHETRSTSKYRRNISSPSHFFVPKNHQQCDSTSITVSVHVGFGASSLDGFTAF